MTELQWAASQPYLEVVRQGLCWVSFWLGLIAGAVVVR